MVKRCGKKASLFMPETIVKFVLAVVAVAFMFWVVWQFVSPLLENQELKKAEAQLNAIISLAESVKEGETAKHLVVNPAGWYLVHYDVDFVKKNSYEMPQKCKGQDCLCMCPLPKEGISDVRNAIEAMVPIRGMAKGGWQNYFYYRDKSGLKGVVMCEHAGVCKNLNHQITLNNLNKYKEWASFNNKFISWIPLPFQTMEVGSVNWISLFHLPKDIFLQKEGDKVYISEDFLANTPIMNSFLNEKITYVFNTGSSQIKSSETFKEFILFRGANSCGYYDKSAKIILADSVWEDNKELLKKEIKVYFEKLHDKIWVGSKIEIYIIKGDETTKSTPFFEVSSGKQSLTSPVISEVKYLCKEGEKDIGLFISLTRYIKNS